MEIEMSFAQWPRIIVHMDMDAFFAQIEQRDFKQLRGQPVCVTNGEQGSCIITRSYEARKFGVKTGMRLREAKRLCPQLIQRPSRPDVYAKVSTRIMQLLYTVTPDIQIFSVDEAFLDLSNCRYLYDEAQQVGACIQRLIWDGLELTCSVGISGDKTTAKVASKRNKPNGVYVITPEQTKSALAPLKVSELCGIGPRTTEFLAQHGVYYCYQMEQLPVSVLAQRFGHLGRRIWKMCLGEDPDLVSEKKVQPKSIGHGKVLPPNTASKQLILSYLCHMAEKVAYRLRTHESVAQKYYLGIKLKTDWLGSIHKTMQPTDNGVVIYRLAKLLVEQSWQGEGVYQCQITALDPQHGSGQSDLFAMQNDKQTDINAVMDAINHKFSGCGLVRTPCLRKLHSPDVISPAWRPKELE